MIILKLTIDGGLNMLKTYKSFFLPIFLVASYAWGSIQVSGSVTNKNGEALPYANVSVLGLNVGTASSVDGTFSLKNAL